IWEVRAILPKLPLPSGGLYGVGPPGLLNLGDSATGGLRRPGMQNVGPFGPQYAMSVPSGLAPSCRSL
ncbi:MAG: hypothetical protein ACK57P_08815, partial [Planctomycetota bacterium]